MSIKGPILEIDKFLGLADPGRASRFVWDSREMFREVEVLGTASVHF
jgi:hypothetical protein